MKTVEKLTNAVQNMKLGNHRVEFTPSGRRKFYYHWTAICTVDDRTMTFVTDDGGWNTISTKRAINAYRRHFESFGYREVETLSELG